MSKVIIYTTETCHWCHAVKEFLKKNKISFTEKDVGEDADAAREMIKKSGQRGVPVIDVDGKIIVGFDEDELRKALNIK